jgi:hypothetical protein
MPRAKLFRNLNNISPEIEARIKEACDTLHSGSCKNMSKVAKEFNVPYGTLRNR